MADVLIDGQRPDNLFVLFLFFFFLAVLSFPCMGFARAAFLGSRLLLSMRHRCRGFSTGRKGQEEVERFSSPLEREQWV